MGSMCRSGIEKVVAGQIDMGTNAVAVVLSGCGVYDGSEVSERRIFTLENIWVDLFPIQFYWILSSKLIIFNLSVLFCVL
jgi:hypothetical protein